MFLAALIVEDDCVGRFIVVYRTYQEVKARVMSCADNELDGYLYDERSQEHQGIVSCF